MALSTPCSRSWNSTPLRFANANGRLRSGSIATASSGAASSLIGLTAISGLRSGRRGRRCRRVLRRLRARGGRLLQRLLGPGRQWREQGLFLVLQELHGVRGHLPLQLLNVAVLLARLEARVGFVVQDRRANEDHEVRFVVLALTRAEQPA